VRARKESVLEYVALTNVPEGGPLLAGFATFCHAQITPPKTTHLHGRRISVPGGQLVRSPGTKWRMRRGIIMRKSKKLKFRLVLSPDHLVVGCAGESEKVVRIDCRSRHPNHTRPGAEINTRCQASLLHKKWLACLRSSRGSGNWKRAPHVGASAAHGRGSGAAKRRIHLRSAAAASATSAVSGEADRQGGGGDRPARPEEGGFEGRVELGHMASADDVLKV